MKTKLFIFAITALGMLACTPRNTPDQTSSEEGVIPGKEGDLVGCWAVEGEYTGYYEFASDGYMVCWGNNINNLYKCELWYIDERYLSADYYEQLEWTKKYEAPYQYDKNRLTVYIGLTPTMLIEWIDGSHANIESIGSCKRIDPKKYLSNLKTYPEDYEKDWQAVMKGHEKHFCVGKDENHNLKWIEFAPGNLQYQASTNTWRFAPQQYEMTAKTPDGNTWADLFDRSYYNTICAAFSPEWRFLRSGECDTLLSSYPSRERPYASYLHFKSTVAGVYGLIILPDSWAKYNSNSWWSIITWPEGITEEDQYSAEQWAILEANGAVFLPATSWDEGHQPAVRRGLYMLNSEDAMKRINLLSFSEKSGPQTDNQYGRDYSVRLVKNAK